MPRKEYSAGTVLGDKSGKKKSEFFEAFFIFVPYTVTSWNYLSIIRTNMLNIMMRTIQKTDRQNTAEKK